MKASPSRQALRDRREALDLTLDDIAVAWGYCDPAAISRWERNKKKHLPGLRSPEEYAALLDNELWVGRVLAERNAKRAGAGAAK